MEWLDNLSLYKKRIERDLKKSGSTYSYEDYLGYCGQALRLNGELLTCDPCSLMGAFLHCAGMGLMPNTPFNHISIEPYYRPVYEKGKWTRKKEAKVIMGYQGWIEIIYRNPSISKISSSLVYASDVFDEIGGTSPSLSHIVDKDKKDTTRVAAYAIAWVNGVPAFQVVYRKDIEAIRDISLSLDAQDSIWVNEESDPFGWMWRKTAIKQLAKILPKTKYLEQAIHLDNMLETGSGTVKISDNGELKVVESEKATESIITKNKKKQSKAVVSNILKGKK